MYNTFARGLIESNTENSWLEYLNNMPLQGTWSDAMIIQAVADQLQLKIFIAETHEHFNEMNFLLVRMNQSVFEVRPFSLYGSLHRL